MAGKKASISINILADAAKAKAGFAEAERAATGLDKQFAAIAKTAVNAFATQQIVNFGKQAVNSASDLAESANAVAVTFEDAADGILALGENASKSVGLSAKDFNAFAVQFAGFTKQLTTADRDIVDVTDELTVRIADFASVMNLDVPDAASKFRQALSGETEGMKQFGIDVSAAAVQTYALANGISDSAASMTEAEKVQARYGLLMESTAKMSGDFANTSDGLANQQRILAAELENVKATVGEAMVPALQALLGAVGPVIDAFTSLPEGLQQAVVLAGAGAVGFKTMSNSLAGFGLSAKNARLAVAGLGAAMAGMTVALNVLGDIQANVTSGQDQMAQVLSESGNVFDEHARRLLRMQLLSGDLGDAVAMLGVDLDDMLDAALGNSDAIDRISKATDDAVPMLGDFGFQIRRGVGLLNDQEEAALLVRETLKGYREEIDQTARETERMAAEQERLARESTYTAHAIDELAVITDTATQSADAFGEQFATSSGKVVEFGWNVKQARYELDAFYGRLAAEEELQTFNEELDAIQAELDRLIEGTEEYNDKLREGQLLVAGLSDNVKKIPDALELKLTMAGDFDRLQRVLAIATGPETYSARPEEELAFMRGASARPSGIVQNITINMPAGTNGQDIVDELQRYNRVAGAAPFTTTNTVR